MAAATVDSDPKDQQSLQPSPAILASNRDLSLIPDGVLTQEFVDQFLKSKCHASGDQHVSKGYKYFHENYVKKRLSKYQ